MCLKSSIFNMVEYPSIINSSKAPRKHCFAFDKLDGSNIRVKYNPKTGFNLFGSRHALIDETHPHLHEVIPYFNNNLANQLTSIFKKHFYTEQEIIVFGEFFGTQSFAGMHNPTDSKKFVMFDVLLGKKNRKFIPPNEFIKLFDGIVEIPRLVYTGNLNDEFIADVRKGKYGVDEGVICKGTEKSGAFMGGIWQCKIKSEAYLQKLQTVHGKDWVKYWE